MTQNADSERVTLSFTVQVTAGTDVEELADRMFDFLGADPDDLFPEVTEVEFYRTQTDSSGVPQ